MFFFKVCPGAPLNFQGEAEEKILSCFWQGEGESNNFEKHPEHSALLKNSLLSRETVLPEPKELEFCKTWKKGNFQLQSF